MPNRKRDISLTLALCLSLTVHAWVVHWVVKEYVAEWATLLLPPLAKAEPIAINAPPEPAPPPPAVRVVDRMSQLGDDNASGTAIADSPGDEPQLARRATQEQASLSLDPEGTGGTEASKPLPPSPPVFAQAPQPEDAKPQPKFEVPGSSAPPPQPQPQPVPVASNQPGEALAQADVKPTEQPPEEKPADEPREPVDQPPTDAVASATPSPTPEQPQPQRQPTEQSQQPQQPQTAQRPTPQSSAELPGDPAPLADAESDAFSTQESVEFRRGKTVARLGRKHKLISPRLEMAAYADLMQMRPPVRIVLRLHLDTTGNVVKAEIIKSSGSINLDQPTRQAAYRWWFEPPRDASGKPKADVFEFVVGFT